MVHELPNAIERKEKERKRERGELGQAAIAHDGSFGIWSLGLSLSQRVS